MVKPTLSTREAQFIGPNRPLTHHNHMTFSFTEELNLCVTKMGPIKVNNLELIPVF